MVRSGQTTGNAADDCGAGDSQYRNGHRDLQKPHASGASHKAGLDLENKEGESGLQPRPE